MTKGICNEVLKRDEARSLKYFGKHCLEIWFQFAIYKTIIIHNPIAIGLKPVNKMRPHRNLIVWQQSIELVKKIYIITRDFPETEKFGIISQMRRAAVSIPSNIAEGAARKTDKDYARFLHIWSGSLSELDTLLFISNELGFLKKEEFESMNTLNEKVFALLNGLIKSVEAKIV